MSELREKKLNLELDEALAALNGQLKNGAVDERIAAAQAMAGAHDIHCYALLRDAAKNDPEQSVREAVLAAARALEDEFGEDACLADQAAIGGTYVDDSCDACDAAASGDYYGISLNNFR